MRKILQYIQSLFVTMSPAPSEFSVKATEQLFAVFPDWRGYAAVEQGEDGSHFIRVEVPAPSETNARSGLVVSTADDEVTVEFDYSHSRFDEMVGDGEHFGTEATIHFISR